MALTPTNRARGAIDVNLITGYDESFHPCFNG